MGARAVSHGRCVTFQMAEVAMPGQMFADIPSLIAPAAGTTHASTRGALRSDATGRQQNQRVYAHQSGPTGRLDHFLRTRNALHSCPTRSEGRSSSDNHRNRGNAGERQRAVADGRFVYWGQGSMNSGGSLARLRTSVWAGVKHG